MKRRNWLLGLLLAPMLALAESPSPAPLFAAPLVDLSGKPTGLEPFRGRPLVVNFWARWCGPCREEIPSLVAERARVHGSGLEVIGIALDDKAEAVRDFAKAYEINYPVLLTKDDAIELMRAPGNPKAGLPFTIVLDRQGKVVFTKLGAMSKAELAAAVAAAQR